MMFWVLGQRCPHRPEEPAEEEDHDPEEAFEAEPGVPIPPVAVRPLVTSS